MEPTDLNSPTPASEPVEHWLREHAARAPLPDDGFSTRVLAALPPPAADARASARRLAHRRQLLLFIGALAGIGFVTLTTRSAPAGTVSVTLDQLVQAFTGPGTGLAVLVTAASLAVVYWPRRWHWRRMFFG